MNWLQNSTLVSVAIGMLVMVACKSGDEISSEIRPRDKDLGADYENGFTLETKVVNFDSIRTNASYRLLVGRHTDPAFGTVTANAYLRFVNNTLRTSFGPNPKADSVYLQFNIGVNGLSPYFYGSSSNKVNIKIYRNTEAINSDSIYFRTKSFSYDANNLLAEKTIDNSTLNTSVTSRNFYVGLPKYLANELINSATKFSATATFQDFFRGLALVSDDANQSIIGIYDVQLVLLYHNYYGLNNLYSAESDLISASFYNNPFAAQNEFRLDRNTGDLASLGQNIYNSISTISLNNLCYIQPNSGTFTKVQFTSIEAFKESVKTTYQATKILVNKAELVIKPYLIDSATYSLPQQLYALEMTSDGKVKRISANSFQYLQEELGGIFGTQNPLYAVYNVSLQEYKFTVTAYVQALIDGSKPNNGLLLGAPNALGGGSLWIFGQIKVL